MNVFFGQILRQFAIIFTNKATYIYAFLIMAILGSALMVAHQVYAYRYDYRELNVVLRERDDLNADWGRLLIEKQTFGATAQIGTRAVTQLRMYSPPPAETVVITLPSHAQNKK